MNETGARILIYDIETAPIEGFVWRKWDTNLIHGSKYRDWYMLSVAWKWLGEKKTFVQTLPDFERYEDDPKNDFELAWSLRDLFNLADVTVTHNGVTFDKPKAQTRMLFHGLEPPSTYKEIDTLKVARKQFAMTSNALGDLCEFLSLPHKGDPGGFSTWFGCMNGDPKSWRRMARYNKRDVDVLEQLYLRLRPWIPNHPNLAVIGDRPDVCPYCGSNGPFQARGHKNYSVTRRRQFQCQACNSWIYSRKTERIPSEYVSS